MKAKLITKTVSTLQTQERTYDVRDTELSGFLLRVLPTGSMAYFCDYRRKDGRRTRLKLGSTSVLTPSQARDEALKALGDVARGIDPSAARKAARQDTLSDFIGKQYQPWVEAHRKTGAQTVSRVLKRFSEFKDAQLTDISPWKVEKWRSARLKAGIMVSTVNRNVTMLKAILQKAVEWEVIDANPIAKVKPMRIDSSAKVRYLVPEEESALRAALDAREERIRAERRSHNAWCATRGYAPYVDLEKTPFADHLKPMALLSINTGMRRGEVFNLRWEDVSLDRKMLVVQGATAKSGKSRHIPLNKEALETLVGWKTQSKTDGLVFPSSKGGRFDNVNTSWEAVLGEAGILNFRWHDMRHHFASRLVMAGVDLNTVRELLGHGDLKMTIRYAHLAPQIKAEAVAKLDFTLHPARHSGGQLTESSVKVTLQNSI